VYRRVWGFVATATPQRWKRTPVPKGVPLVMRLNRIGLTVIRPTVVFMRHKLCSTGKAG
jgi:hypothetical protein